MKNRIKVLIIDDNEIQLIMTRQWLELDGFDVVTKNSPFGTALAIRREQPDIVLLDLSMPGLDGHGVVEVLKQQPGSPRIGIIFYSSQDRRQLDAVVRKHSALGAIPKTEIGNAFIAEFRRLTDAWMAAASTRS
jgi:CheY-like chemotaxis protein